MEREIRCKVCDRYLGKIYGTTIAEIRCTSSCKNLNQVKVIGANREKEIHFKFLHLKEELNIKEVIVS